MPAVLSEEQREQSEKSKKSEEAYHIVDFAWLCPVFEVTIVYGFAVGLHFNFVGAVTNADRWLRHSFFSVAR